ncbi:MAG: hypothetical protein K2G45_09445 [Lachnospiraceae bacterium]|nr:hypothetical protein [Lachnospiraceae bacterium]
MGMNITNNYNSYNANYAAAYSKKHAPAEKAEDTKSQSEAKTDKETFKDYYSYLQNKYDCVKDGKVSISGSYLKQCAKDPEKAKELEENLAYFKESYEKGYQNALNNARAHGAKLIDYSETWSIDNKGNVTMMAQTTLSSGKDVKGSKEIKKEQEERLKKKKEKERLEEKKKEEKLLRENQQKEMMTVKKNEGLAGNADIINKNYIPFDVTG